MPSRNDIAPNRTEDVFMKPCQSTTIFGRVDLCAALPPLAKAGYRLIELSRKTSRRAEYKRMLDDLGMRVWAVHGTLGIVEDPASEQERRKRVEDELRAMEDVAAYAPCPYIVHYLCLDSEPRSMENWKRAVEALHERARSLGFVLALEAVPAKPREEGGLPYLWKSAEIARFVKSFRSDHLGICMDVNHVNLSESIPSAAANSVGLIRAIHVSDNHGIVEEHLPPGEGIIDWPSALAAIYRAGYEGPIAMELHVPPTHELFVRTYRWAVGMAEVVRQSLSAPTPTAEASTDPRNKVR